MKDVIATVWRNGGKMFFVMGVKVASRGTAVSGKLQVDVGSGGISGLMLMKIIQQIRNNGTDVLLGFPVYDMTKSLIVVVFTMVVILIVMVMMIMMMLVMIMISTSWSWERRYLQEINAL